MSSLPPPEVEVGLAAPEPGPRVPAPFGRRRCPVVANDAAGAYRLLAVEDGDGPSPLAGQFYMLAAAEGWGGADGERPYLARAFSVCRARGPRLEFLVERLGPGTTRLAALRAGEEALLVGPLGVGFSNPRELGGEGALLVGGGAGVAPLVIWAEALAGSGGAPRTLVGFRSSDYCDATLLFPGPVEVATDDGSVGHEGRVTELLEPALDAGFEGVVYACGPPAMLEAVRRICAGRSLPAQLALEQAMACGYGACFGCVVRTTTGYRRICVDGPVVNASDIDQSWLDH